MGVTALHTVGISGGAGERDGSRCGWCSEVRVERRRVVNRAVGGSPLNRDVPAFGIDSRHTDRDSNAGINLLRRSDGHVGRRIVSDIDRGTQRGIRSGFIGDANRVGIGDAE